MEIVNVGSQNYYSHDSKTGPTELGKNDFIKILVAQFSNQDPLSPNDDKQFIAQLAQFSVVESMSNLSASVADSGAHALVGKTIYSEVDTASGAIPFAGKVDAVVKYNGNTYYRLGTDNIPTSALKGVYDLAEGEDTQVVAATDLLGRYVRLTLKYQEETTDEDGNTVTTQITDIVNGKVERVYSQDGAAYLMVDDVEVKYSHIADVMFFADVSALQESYKELTK